jgi:hypothetical protein
VSAAPGGISLLAEFVPTRRKVLRHAFADAGTADGLGLRLCYERGPQSFSFRKRGEARALSRDESVISPPVHPDRALAIREEAFGAHWQLCFVDPAGLDVSPIEHERHAFSVHADVH